MVPTILLSPLLLLILLSALALEAVLADHSTASQRAQHQQDIVASSFLGGATTYPGAPSSQSFSQPSHNIPPMDRAQFLMGDSLFSRSWVFAPSSLKNSDGLGPLFNARSCQGCHIKDGRGHLPQHPEDSATSALVKLALLSSQPTQHVFPLAQLQPDPVYGSQFHDSALPTLAAEGHIVIRWHNPPPPSSLSSQHPLFPLRSPLLHLSKLAYGPLHPRTQKSLRIAPPMIGLGLLEAIATKDILKNADPFDRDQDGISGRASWVQNDQDQPRYVLGRFGWKASQPTLMAQNLTAFFKDMGMTSAMHSAPEGDCTQPKQESCYQAAHYHPSAAAEQDISDDIAELILFYTRSLAPPQQRIPQDPTARKHLLQGAQLFTDIGCTSCHTPSHRTSSTYAVAHLRNQTIFPYTDLLLHDLGKGLDDSFSTPHASSSEWRTPPLWGIGLTQRISPEAGFLHDGRARTIEEAILWHGGEGKASRTAFQNLTYAQKQALLRFLHSL